ncbi:(RS)-norcoclaurine 6-O-methyltransferase-like [Magnolia sinica]|uniref:(RS)-norcoclaurine 6-O-methyltransferase-like n=1 Tax=Magnolia sinica TaxID=86752 RepID=UPI00265AD1C0|nr:(RS)-norcoclaurine 6-O-methyltransferase-like [Magnolia sinica]
MDEAAQEMQSQAQVWKHVYAFTESHTLRCAVELGIADIIDGHGRPITVPQLAARIPVPCTVDRLQRLMRFLVGMGVFRYGEIDAGSEQTFGLTPVSEFLVRGTEKSLVAMVMVGFDVLMVPWHHMIGCLEENACAVFESVFGSKFWEYAGEEVEFGRRLNEVMACDTRSTMKAVVKQCRGVFEGVGSIVDVGGGIGAAARALAEEFPGMKCTVFDHPHVIESSMEWPGVDWIGGDMFEFIPPADALLLKWILHNHGDEECLMILNRCKEAMPENGGKLIIVDTVIDDSDDATDEFSSAKLALDLEMMLLFKGKERTKEEWQRLLGDAGFSQCTITPIQTSIHALIEAHL